MATIAAALLAGERETATTTASVRDSARRRPVRLRRPGRVGSRCRVAVGELAQQGPELWRVQHLERDVQAREVTDEVTQGIAAGLQNAAVLVDRAQQAARRRDALGDDLGGCVEADARRVLPRQRAGPAYDVARGVLGRLARREPRPGGQAWPDAVGPKRAPVLAVAVPREQVPAATGVDEAVRLHAARAGLAVAPPVVEAQLLVVAAGAGDGRERLG